MNYTPKKEQAKIPIIRYYLISFCPVLVFLLIYSVVQIISDNKYSLTAPCTAEITAEETNLLEQLSKQLPKLKTDISADGKLEILQAVADIETLHMNIPPVAVEMGRAEVGQAWYDNDTNTIYINERRYEKTSTKQLIENILHECRHAFQRYVTSNIDCEFEDIQDDCIFQDEHIYKDNFENYIGDERLMFDNKHYKEYLRQPVEADANRYSKHRIRVYSKFL